MTCAKLNLIMENIKARTEDSHKRSESVAACCLGEEEERA
jgi:hypothetical protein